MKLKKRARKETKDKQNRKDKQKTQNKGALMNPNISSTSINLKD